MLAKAQLEEVVAGGRTGRVHRVRRYMLHRSLDGTTSRWLRHSLSLHGIQVRNYCGSRERRDQIFDRVGARERVLRGEDLPLPMALLHYMLQMALEDVAAGGTACGSFDHSRDFEIDVDDQYFGSSLCTLRILPTMWLPRKAATRSPRGTFRGLNPGAT